MNTIIEMLPDRLMTSAEVGKAIKKDLRTVQDLARAKVLRATLQKRDRGGTQWMFDPESVREYLQNPGKLKPKSMALTRTTAVTIPPKAPKKTQAERALDTVTLLANVVATMNKDREMFIKALEAQNQLHAKTLENVLGTVLGRVFDAQRADREDAKTRIN